MRTVVVGMRPRDSREKSLPYQTKNLYLANLPMQRLVVVTLAEKLPLAKDNEELEVYMIEPRADGNRAYSVKYSWMQKTDATIRAL